jgi:GABA(A) receptor-associated protein
MSYKQHFDLEKRMSESLRIRKKYPDRVPIIIEQSYLSEIDPIEKKKYLVPCDLTIGKFLFFIRDRLKIQQEHALFLFINNTLPANSCLMSEIYKEYKDVDGFVYGYVSGESTFGFM